VLHVEPARPVSAAGQVGPAPSRASGGYWLSAGCHCRGVSCWSTKRTGAQAVCRGTHQQKGLGKGHQHSILSLQGQIAIGATPPKPFPPPLSSHIIWLCIPPLPPIHNIPSDASCPPLAVGQARSLPTPVADPGPGASYGLRAGAFGGHPANVAALARAYAPALTREHAGLRRTQPAGSAQQRTHRHGRLLGKGTLTQQHTRMRSRTDAHL
jgi:hypothetical protein